MSEQNFDLYRDIAKRTDGDVYIGVVGPVRTGKSTLISRMMEELVLSRMAAGPRRERLTDELPQSGSGKTIMTTQPKFVPSEAVSVTLDDQSSVRVRMVDSVGYLVEGALGTEEDGASRMVHTPWFDYDIPFEQAAEIGTRKVITEHSTIGIVITTDGSISEIPREDYLEPEERVIRELQEIGKPFIVLLNSQDPKSDRAIAIAGDIASRYEVKCVPVNCLQLEEEDVGEILKAVLYEFPMRELDIFLPPWVDALPGDHPMKTGIYDAIRQSTAELHHIREIDGAVKQLGENENVSEAVITAIDLGTGVAAARVSLPREMFYQTLSEQSGFQVGDDGDLMSLLTKLAGVKAEYDKVAGALKDVRETGYGIVVPSIDELKLEEPEIMKQGGRYGVRLKASAPSIHIQDSKQKFQNHQSAEWQSVSGGCCSCGMRGRNRPRERGTIGRVLYHIPVRSEYSDSGAVS